MRDSLWYKMDGTVLTSKNNETVKYISSLSDKHAREEHSCFVLEGLRAVSEAVYAGQAEMLVFSQTFYTSHRNSSILRDSRAKKYVLSDSLFGSISGTKTPQGAAAVCRIKKHDLHCVLSEESRILLLEDLQDPGNMGTVIRTAAAAGFKGIICSDGCVDVYNPKVSRSTAGCIFREKIIQCRRDVINAADEIKHSGYKIYAAHPRGGTDLFKTHFDGKICIALGNEARGLSERMLRACDGLVTIHMEQGVESLNASVAAALMMYETVRQKNDLTGG